MNLIQPNAKSVEERRQQLNQLDLLRNSISDRRRASSIQLISERLSKFVQSLEKCDNAHVYRSVQHLLQSIAASYNNVTPAGLISAAPAIQSDQIVDKFGHEREQNQRKVSWS